MGTWVGEKALVNPALFRSGTCITTKLSSVLTVPGKEFHELIAQMELTHTFEQICEYKLPYGLCGRCGALGDHRANDCPQFRERGDTKASSQLSSRRPHHVDTQDL